MAQLLEWSPLIIFFVAFKTLDIYWATAALMIGCVAVALVHRLRAGSFKTMHLFTAGVAVALGTATLLLHDKRFIQWKPTVLLGLACIAFLGSMLGQRPLVRRLLESVFEEPLQVSPRAWMNLNALWAAWFACLAVANIYVAHTYPDAVWVNFKVFGITGATLLFVFPQAFWLSSRVKPAAPERA